MRRRHSYGMGEKINTFRPAWAARPAKRSRTYTEINQPVYSSTRWKRLRMMYLREHLLCECGCGEPAEHVHHRLDVKDRPDLAFEWSNLEALTASCHAKLTAGNHGNARYVVCGPPGAGKTSWVKRNAPADALVWDMDAIGQAIGFGSYPRPADLVGLLMAWRATMVNKIKTDKLPRPVYIIISDPSQAAIVPDEINARLVEIGPDHTPHTH